MNEQQLTKAFLNLPQNSLIILEDVKSFIYKY